jgi:hypothetical protein
MANRGFLYRRAGAYKFGLRAVHGRQLDQRYEYMAEMIGSGVKVLEPLCGPALLPDYLRNCSYAGFDLNEKFVEHAAKADLDVRLRDATDPRAYERSDVVVLCDALHHLTPEQEKRVLQLSFESARRKLIVCDPCIDHYDSLFPAWLPGRRWLMERVYEFLEKDGSNNAKLENRRTRTELQALMLGGFGVVPDNAARELRVIGKDLIVTYSF